MQFGIFTVGDIAPDPVTRHRALATGTSPYQDSDHTGPARYPAA